MFTVYCPTSPSGKRYVGVTRLSAAKRWTQHTLAASRGDRCPLHYAIRKHGADNFTHEVLERMTTEAGAKRAEQLWIAQLGTFGSGGYNATLGGDGMRAWVPSSETRERVSAAQKIAHAKDPARRSAFLRYVTGPRSSVHRARISAAHLKRSALTPRERVEKKKALHAARNARYRAKDSVKAARAEKARAATRAKKAGA